MRVVCGNWIQFLISTLVTVGFFGCLFYLLKFGYPYENKDMINAMLGVLATIWTLQMNYFFGSSSSSKNKDDTLSALASSAPLTGTGVGVLPKAETVNVTVNPPVAEPQTEPKS